MTMGLDPEDFQTTLEVIYVPCGRPGHRGYPTNGMHDGLCPDCEYEMSDLNEEDYDGHLGMVVHAKD